MLSAARERALLRHSSQACGIRRNRLNYFRATRYLSDAPLTTPTVLDDLLHIGSPKKGAKKVVKKPKHNQNKAKKVIATEDGATERYARRARTEEESRPPRKIHPKGENSLNILKAATRPRRPWNPPAPTPRKAKREGSFPSFSRRIEGILGASTSSPEEVLKDVDPPSGRAEIATLAHGLDRVLFNPGVHLLQDFRTRVYNFTPHIKRIPEVRDFAFERLPPYVVSSRDNELVALAKEHGKRFTGSTSSLTGFLSQIYYLLSDFMLVNLKTLGYDFLKADRSFTPGQKAPVSLAFRHRDGIYAIDRISLDPDNNALNILSWQGTLLEKFLTYSPEQFAPLMRSNPPRESQEKQREAYRYSKSDSFIMRSQLDCHDSRLPGTGVFDMKTRAVYPIRMDRLAYKENQSYHLRTIHGALESFEKEYYDLIRSAFLKFSFQARIGNMDGIFVAYHNTERLFGFQYIPLEEMDARLYGREDVGWRVFERCVKMMELVSEEIVNTFPKQSVLATVETVEKNGEMRIWIEPLPDSSAADQEAALQELLSTGIKDESSVSPEAPIVELTVRVKHFLDQKPVAAFAAIKDNRPWTLQWGISRSSLSNDVIRKRLESARRRQTFPYSLPTGVGLEDIPELWKSMSFSPDAPNIPPALQDRLSELFRSPSSLVRRLRKLTKERSEEIAEREKEESGKEKVVWRQAPPLLFDGTKESEALGSASPEERTSPAPSKTKS